MSPQLSALPIATAVLLSTASPSGSSREIDNVAAFARLYGVVRFFYPSDAAAELDWNRFAVHGVARVRSARSATELETTLKQLVAAFERAQIAPVDPAGEKFDPHRHQAMAMLDADAAAGTVVTVFQKGYLLHDRVLRPALVAVAKAKEGSAPAA